MESSQWLNDFVILNAKTTSVRVLIREQDLNVRRPYSICHYCIQATDGKGTIVNATSLDASFLHVSSYAASKLALIKIGEFLDLGMHLK